jgi:protein MpaA
VPVPARASAPERSAPARASEVPDAEDGPLAVSVVGEGPLTVLFLATIHGDEAAGTPLLEELLARVAAEPALVAERRLVVLPVANPSGKAHGRRTNAAGVDLNRNFPSANWNARPRHGSAPLSEPESRQIAALVEAWRPARIVSFHQPASLIDYDGPGEELARALGRTAPLPVRRMGARPGSLGSWAGETLGIPGITVELPGTAGRLGADALWVRYGALVLDALRFEPSLAAPRSPDKGP